MAHVLPTDIEMFNAFLFCSKIEVVALIIIYTVMLLCLLQTRMARSRFVHTCGKGRYKNRLKIYYQKHIRSKQRCDEYFFRLFDNVK